MIRCPWVPGDDDLYRKYHDLEWGVPVYDDRKLFEFLLLEGAQAGLSWRTVLYKRENYHRVFDDFDYQKIASYGNEKITKLLLDSGIIRNKLKINSAVRNAQSYISIIERVGSFSRFIWKYVEGTPVVNKWRKLEEIPVTTELSDRISMDLKKEGFNFVGSTIIYSFLQAVGIVNDHTVDCFRYNEIIDKYNQ